MTDAATSAMLHVVQCRRKNGDWEDVLAHPDTQHTAVVGPARAMLVSIHLGPAELLGFETLDDATMVIHLIQKVAKVDVECRIVERTITYEQVDKPVKPKVYQIKVKESV